MTSDDTDKSTDASLEAGRLLFARPWDFVMGSPGLGTLPPMRGLEIAFAGRSNVGKSSLINALTGRKALARTSNTPGRTQELNFFRGGDDRLFIVDMPGYGFAQAPEPKVKAWTRLIHDYLRGRANLVRVYILIDARHGLKPNDLDVLKSLDTAAVSYQIVLTKADQIKPSEQAALLARTHEALAKRPAAFPQVILTSSAKGDGIDELRAAIARLLEERGQ